MRGGGGAVLLAAAGLLLGSCGLETVATLSPPNANYNDQALVQNSSLSFKHQDYGADSPFQEYLVYYKIYTSESLGFASLSADNGTLGSSPTVATLQGMGYKQLFSSSDSDASGTGSDLQPLTVSKEWLSAGALVALDFNSFLSVSAQKPQDTPRITVGGTPAPRPYLYRDLSALTDRARVSFWRLQPQNPAVDVFDRPSTPATAKYEMNVFVVAHGFTGSLQEIFSKPVPWGVIRTMTPSP